jgi:excisionase family DNA binding protein
VPTRGRSGDLRRRPVTPGNDHASFSPSGAPRDGRHSRTGAGAVKKSGNSGRTATGRLALSPNEAAAALGVSRDFLDHHVMPKLRVVRLGRRRLIPVHELERWLEREAAFAVDARLGNRPP